MTEPTPNAFSHPGFCGYIGVASADITPPIGIYHRNWGAAKGEVAEGVDPNGGLALTVMTLQAEAGGDPLVIASADLGWWRDPEDERYVRGAALAALKLDSSRFLLNLSHTHAGPALCRDDADKPGGVFIGPYINALRDTLIETTRRALEEAKLASLDFSYGKCAVATNRDLPSPEGGGRYLCGFNPAAPADDTLLVGRYYPAGGRAMHTLVNYACHPTILAHENRLISPDFVGILRAKNRPTGHLLFLQGASGELAPRRQHSSDRHAAFDAGAALAGAVNSTLDQMLPEGSRLEYDCVVESGAPLALWKQVPHAYPKTLKAICVEVELPIKPEWRGETDEERRWEVAGDAAALERLRRRRRIRLALGGGQTAKMPLWIWQIGDAFFVGHPNEAYSDLQTELRSAYPDTVVVVMNITNGWYGYLPPADCYGTDRYSVWQTPFEKGSLEILIERCKRAIRDLRAAPQERRAD